MTRWYCLVPVPSPNRKCCSTSILLPHMTTYISRNTRPSEKTSVLDPCRCKFPASSQKASGAANSLLAIAGLAVDVSCPISKRREELKSVRNTVPFRWIMLDGLMSSWWMPSECMYSSADARQRNHSRIHV
jgi:hypothetical protein